MSHSAKKEVKFMHNAETRIALLEQNLSHITSILSEINDSLKDMKFDIDKSFADLERVTKEENAKVWRKLELLDQRINDNFKYLMGIVISLFSGLYATALGGMLLRLCHWI